MSQENEMAGDDSEMIVECNDSLDVTLVSDFKALLQQTMGLATPVVLDASRLERVDGAALQLLAAFFVEARESGIHVSWREPSEQLRDAADLAGLSATLQL